MAEFDPDAYLAQPSTPEQPQFDPDQYLAQQPQALSAPTGYVGRGEFAPEAGAVSAPVVQGVTPEGQVVRNIAGAAVDLATGIPQMAASFPGQLYRAARYGVAQEALKQAIPMGEQLAADVQAPLGSRESFRGLGQLLFMATPALHEVPVRSLADTLFGTREVPPLRTEPLQPEPPRTIPIGPGTISGDVSRALERRFTMVPEAPPEIAPAPTLEETLGAVSTEPVRGVQGQVIYPERGGTPQIRTFPSETARVQPVSPEPTVVTEPDVIPPVAEQAAAPVSQGLKGLIDRYDEGDSKIQTVRDLVDEVDSQHGDDPAVAAAVEKYREDMRENMEEFGGRGDEDQIDSEFLSAMQQRAAPVSPAPVPESKGFIEAFKTMKGAVSDSYVDSIWKKVQEGKPIQRIAPLENTLREAQKSGQLKSREDVADIIQNFYKPKVSPITTEEPISQQPEGGVRAEETTGAQAQAAAETIPPETQAPTQTGAEEAIGGVPNSEPGVQPGAGAPEGGGVGEQQPVIPPEEAKYAGVEPVSTKNVYTEAQRSVRGFPEAEQAARRGFGTVWDEAGAQAREDPNIGRRLVDELNTNPRPISDVENAHLLRREIEAQKEHSDAVDAVNNSTNETDRIAAQSRLDIARQDLQDVYDATKRAGTKGGQALAARQMLAKEDYSLARMEARRRAANNGQPLNEQQLSEVSDLHEKIQELQNKLDANELARTSASEFQKLLKQSVKEARTERTTTRFTDFMDRQAEAARQRIIARRGRLTTGFDPTAITDEAIIGASHIAKGLTKFADWSVQMIQDFGERVRPYLKDIWDRSRVYHEANAKQYKSPQEIRLERYKNLLAQKTIGTTAQLERGDLTKPTREPLKLDAAAFKMRANLQALKNEFERRVAKAEYQNKSPAQKFWDHFVGVERAMKLSGPQVFGKLGIAAFAREAGLAPVESLGGYGVSKVFPKLAAGTKYGASLKTVLSGEIQAKAAMFTKGIVDAARKATGKTTELEAIEGRGNIRPDFWYNRIGDMHAAIKAPVKRAEFTRSLAQRMDVAQRAGEDINHPEVMTRLSNEAVMDANRAIFQQNSVVSNFFSMLDRQHPAAARTARFFFPVVKIPVNLFKELVTYHAGAPAAALKIGKAYWNGVENLPVPEREAIVRQLVKGSVGGAALIWGYANSDKVRQFFDSQPPWFQHTPIAMAINEGSYLKMMEAGQKEGAKGLGHMAKTDIPFAYTITDAADVVKEPSSKSILNWVHNMIQSSTVPQLVSQVAKEMDKPGPFPQSLAEKAPYRPPTNILESVKVGVPGLRQQVQAKTAKKSRGKSGGPQHTFQ